MVRMKRLKDLFKISLFYCITIVKFNQLKFKTTLQCKILTFNKARMVSYL